MDERHAAEVLFHIDPDPAEGLEEEVAEVLREVTAVDDRVGDPLEV